MTHEVINQIIERVGSGTNFLIVLPPSQNGDSLSAGLALRSFLLKLEKEVTLFSSLPVSPRYSFLPGIESVVSQLDLTKNFVVDISTLKHEVAELSYKKEKDRLAIFIKSKSGQFTPQDVSFRTSSYPFDVIICLGVSGLEMLGGFYSNNADLFFETPIINLDYRPENENYGQLNFVQLTATSVSEIVLDLINRFESSLIDKDIATHLLAGIILETNSFQHIRTTPAAFLKASQLVNLGAKQQDIIRELFKTKSMGLLKLWGRVLARLKTDPKLSIVYSFATKSDIEKSEASDEDVANIIYEMASQLGFAKTFLFFVEDNLATKGYAYSLASLDLLNILSSFTPRANGQYWSFSVNATIPDVADLVIEKFKSNSLPVIQ